MDRSTWRFRLAYLALAVTLAAAGLAAWALLGQSRAAGSRGAEHAKATRAVRQTATRFLGAIERHEVERACALLSRGFFTLHHSTFGLCLVDFAQSSIGSYRIVSARAEHGRGTVIAEIDGIRNDIVLVREGDRFRVQDLHPERTAAPGAVLSA